MRWTTSLILAASIAGTIAASQPAHAISLSSLDAFSTDNEGWRVGNAGVAPTQESGVSFDGQPGFLRHFSDGVRANGKWLMWTQQPDWTGDYATAGVGGVSLWADGRSGGDLPFWLGFDGPGGWFFTPAQTIVTDDDWKRFDFSLAEGDLIYAAASGGTGQYADTFAAVSRFEIFAGPGPVTFAGSGDLLRAGTSNNVVWIDNIAAQPIPEPASALLALLVTTAIGRRRRFRGR